MEVVDDGCDGLSVSVTGTHEHFSLDLAMTIGRFSSQIKLVNCGDSDCLSCTITG